MGAFDNFPYTNFHELNLMWILEALKEIQTTTEQFVAINSLKYADPIQWNIVQQYEKNTIVIDPLTGTAYISVQAVPSGVSLSNEDYWTVVFDLGSFVVRAAKNFTSRHEDETTLTATFNTQAGEWLVWGDTLYVANVNITAGDSYVVDSNITHITIEEVKNEIYSTIGDLADLNTSDKSNLVAAINEVLTTLSDTTGALADLNTSDKSNLVAAINEVLTTLSDTTGALADLNTSDKSNLVAAINEVLTTLSDTAADLSESIGNLDIISVKDYGCICDGVTDDSDGFIDAIAAATDKILVINGDMLISKNIRLRYPIVINGNGHTIKTDATITSGIIGTELFSITGENITIYNLTIDGTDTTDFSSAIIMNGANDITIDSVNVKNVQGHAIWIRDNNENIDLINCYVYNCDNRIRANGGGAIHSGLGLNQFKNSNLHISNCVAKSCGNSGFQFFDCKEVYVENCIAEDMQGYDNWEKANGFMSYSNVMFANCTARDIANAGFYINGSNNIIDGCMCVDCGSIGIDFYTGNGIEGYANIVNGCIFNNCAQDNNSTVYPYNKVIGGTKQYRLSITDCNIVGCGTNEVPLQIIDIDSLHTSLIDSNNIQDNINVQYAIHIRGSEDNNIIQNNRLNAPVVIDNYHAFTKIINNQGSTNNPFIDESPTITENVPWTNTTYRTVMMFVDGTVTDLYLNNKYVGAGINSFLVPPDWIVDCRGTGLTFKMLEL